MIGIIWNRNVVVMTIVLFLIGACATGPTPQPVPTFTNQQLADNAVATAQAEHIAMCNDQAVNHPNELVVQTSPELVVTRNIHNGEKWAIIGLSLTSIPSECGNDYEFRATFSEIGTLFYPEYPDATVMLSNAIFRFVYKDGSTWDLQSTASNNILIATIKNFTGFTQLERIDVIFTIENGFSTPKMEVTILNAVAGQFGENARLEYMSFGDWWVTPSVTPGGYTLDPETTPLPPFPTPTEKYPWLDFLKTDTPMPTQSPSPTASYTPPAP